MSFIKETMARISADTPKYFKKIGAMGIGLTASGTSMLATGALPASIHIPEMIGKVGGYMMLAGFVMTAMSKLPVDPNTFVADEKKATQMGKDSVG